jgi:hypothetical protein
MGLALTTQGVSSILRPGDGVRPLIPGKPPEPFSGLMTPAARDAAGWSFMNTRQTGRPGMSTSIRKDVASALRIHEGQSMPIPLPSPHLRLLDFAVPPTLETGQRIAHFVGQKRRAPTARSLPQSWLHRGRRAQ